MSEKKFIIIFTTIFLSLILLMILIFNHNIIKLTNYFDTKEINKIIDTSLRYNKILYEATDDKNI